MTDPRFQVNLLMAALVALLFLFSYYFKKYTLLRKGLQSLKKEMKTHTMKHGIDDVLWEKFVIGSRKLLGDKRGKEK